MRRRGKPGFTPIEVMIALAILAGVAAIVWRSMALTFETKKRVSQINDRYHEGRQVMLRLARELRMSFLRAELPDEFKEEDPPFTTQFLGEEDELYFVATAHLRLHANARESDQAEFHYFLKSGDEGEYEGKTLYRRESARVDHRPDKGGAIWPLIQGVKELKFEYWDDKKEIADDAWKRSWNTKGEDKDLLPSRIRITLILNMGDDRPEIRFVTQAAPKLRRPISSIPPELQQQIDDAQAAATDPNIDVPGLVEGLTNPGGVLGGDPANLGGLLGGEGDPLGIGGAASKKGPK